MISSNLTWIDEHAPELKGKTLVTLSMEGCIPELKGDAREANTKGGLGIYFGDKLEGLRAIGMDKAFGCMPLYKKRLVQSISNGKQHIDFKDVYYEDQLIEHVLDDKRKPMQFDVWGWDQKNTANDLQYHVGVYKIYRGGACLYLFYCPEVFDILYSDDNTHDGHGREHRFLQETVFAECVYELLKSMNIVPDILHLNEGHVAGAAAIIKGDKAFDKTTVVYTNHTVVPAGLERFSVDRLTGGDVARARYAMRFPWESHQRFWMKFAVQQNGRWFIDFSKGALEICDAANAVSNEHAYATQALFPAYDRRVESVLNGSGDAWIIDELLEAKLTGIESSRETLRRTGAKGKALSLAEVKKRTVGMTDKNGQIISRDGVTLDPDLPTIWMVRRMVEYKSQLPILKDIIHTICANRDEEVDTLWGKMNGLQMQVVLGGVTPEGSNEERWIEEFVGWMQRPDLKGRFVFAPNADTELLRMQAIGADICINCPLPKQEACGTSDQRSARNGGINIATRSGGPPEYIEDGKSGMLVGPYESKEDFYTRAPKDILHKLKELSDMYYNHNNSHSLWLDMKMESYLASPKVSAIAMEQRYADIYVHALGARRSVNENINVGYKAPNIVELPDLALKLREVARDFLYEDPELKGWTVIAGSPYFDQRHGGWLYNWGRDTMIALPGLCLESKMFDIFRDVMKNYMEFVKDGLLPNLIGNGSMPRYNSIDASLWLLWAMGKYLEQTQDYAFLDSTVDRRFSQNEKDTVQDILEEIIDTYRKGMKFEDRWQEDGNAKCQTISIFMDSDYLVSAGNENTQLTWMDVKPKGGKPVTSRHGKAVEINALWYNSLMVMSNIQRHRNSENRGYALLAEKVRFSFKRFWNRQAGCLYDTIDGDPEQGKKIRPNQLFAVAFGLMDSDKGRAIMNRVRQELLTPIGLRTLSPNDPDYRAVHENEYSYHQGTVWPWLIGAFIEGGIITYGKQRTLRILDNVGYFTTLSETLKMFGSVPEVFDGACDSAYNQINGKGCISQAWNVAESLRSISLLLSEDDLPQKGEKLVRSKIIYEMVIRDYYDAQNHTSGLIVASQELPFLAESGVEYVYLLGLMKHAGNPFDIMNPFDIDERAGSFADLDNFISTAHALSINVLTDWLANQHVSKKSPLSKAHPDWFLYTDALDGDYFTDKGMQLCAGRDMQTNKKNLVLVSATDEVPLRGFPRRWSSLAQPDLSHPDVRTHALDIGRFWLAKGLDGFRIDAALSMFPDKIKENWGLNVDDNLTRLFIQDMRRIKPDCFIMFEGFERLEELLQLADYENCSVYNWRPRNLTTDALRDKAALPTLISYLKELEQMQQIRDQLLSLGPEHDAFDFEDPWSKLDYTELLLMHFLYAFMPGYMLVFNGQIFGKQHLYKIAPEKTSPAPRIANADNSRKETGRMLFGLRKEYPQLIEGNYKVLENKGEQDIICLARFDESDIVIGVINPNSDAKKVVFSLSDIINGWLNPSYINCAHYTQDVLLLKNDAKGWISESMEHMPIEKLLREGFYVEIGPRSCKAIRLRLKVLPNELTKFTPLALPVAIANTQV
ncbi:MAG: glycogen/starch synthase [Planctomycetes bacterium]|nr:glycogen/starch synthase [Planctomycetota bacterium]